MAFSNENVDSEKILRPILSAFIMYLWFRSIIDVILFVYL